MKSKSMEQSACAGLPRGLGRGRRAGQGSDRAAAARPAARARLDKGLAAAEGHDQRRPGGVGRVGQPDDGDLHALQVHAACGTAGTRLRAASGRRAPAAPPPGAPGGCPSKSMARNWKPATSSATSGRPHRSAWQTRASRNSCRAAGAALATRGRSRPRRTARRRAARLVRDLGEHAEHARGVRRPRFLPRQGQERVRRAGRERPLVRAKAQVDVEVARALAGLLGRVPCGCAAPSARGLQAGAAQCRVSPGALARGPAHRTRSTGPPGSARPARAGRGWG